MFHFTTGKQRQVGRVIHSTSGCCHLTDLGGPGGRWRDVGWPIDGYLTDFGASRCTLTVILVGPSTATWPTWAHPGAHWPWSWLDHRRLP